MIRDVLSHGQWQRGAPHLPGKPGDLGRLGAANRLFLEAVFRIVRTGSPWRDLHETFGNWNSVFLRFSVGRALLGEQPYDAHAPWSNRASTTPGQDLARHDGSAARCRVCPNG